MLKVRKITKNFKLVCVYFFLVEIFMIALTENISRNVPMIKRPALNLLLILNVIFFSFSVILTYRRKKVFRPKSIQLNASFIYVRSFFFSIVIALLHKQVTPIFFIHHKKIFAWKCQKIFAATLKHTKREEDRTALCHAIQTKIKTYFPSKENKT